MVCALTTSQQQLIDLLKTGVTDHEIATRMALTSDQFQRAFMDLCTQLNLRSRTELLFWCFSSEDSAKAA